MKLTADQVAAIAAELEVLDPHDAVWMRFAEKLAQELLDSHVWKLEEITTGLRQIESTLAEVAAFWVTLTEILGVGSDDAAMLAEVRRLKARADQPEAPTAAPLDMVLHCSKCGLQHIDAPETDEQYNGRLFESSWWECGGDKPERWTNPPHRSHKCSHCNFIWRPADVPTNGVAAVKTTGKADSPIAHPPARSVPAIEEGGAA